MTEMTGRLSVLLEVNAEREKWKTQAKCMRQQEDPELFFPEKGGAALAQAKAAKAVCNGKDGLPVCPVREQCRETALGDNERFGVWGGMSEQERTKERRRRRAREAEARLQEQRRRRVIVRRPALSF